MKNVAINLVFVVSIIVSYSVCDETEKIFTNIYENNYWGNNESVSGPGSTLHETHKIRELLPALLESLEVKTFLDAPCGDFNWLQHVTFPQLNRYVGIDIVSAIIEKNQHEYSNDKRTFLHANILEDELPAADLIMCRDCLVHFPFNEIWTALRNFKKSGARYLLTTTFTGCKKNNNLSSVGKWRSLNFELPPFNFPKPLLLLNEEMPHNNGLYKTKSLALWQLKDLPILDAEPSA